MPKIEIQVKNKIALSPAAQIVCGNSDYEIEFAFDDEWAAHDVKTARFAFAGKYVDVVFSGNICNAPVISGATVCAVGVYAGDLCTTTPALVSCAKSILCGDGLPADPTPDVYSQLVEMTANACSVANSVRADADAGRFDGKKGDKGAKGDKGEKGNTGVGIVWVNNVSVSSEDGGVSTYEILLTDGSTYWFSVKNGSKGSTPEKGVDYYTEADKQEMVDAVLAAQPKPVYELLETITIEENSEVSAWVRDDIACDKIMIKVVCPAEHANGKTTIGIGYNSYTLGMLHQAVVSNATTENHSLAEVFAEDGYWVCQQYLRTNKANSGNMAVQPRYYKVYTTNQCPYLNKYSITNIDNSLPAGTVISVYGVRRNEN